MKKIKLTVVAIIVTLMALGAVSCQRDNDTATNTDKKVEFAVDKEQIATNAWENNDAIGIYMKKAGDPLSATSELSKNSKYLYNESKFTAVSWDQTIFFPASGAVDFISYYPHATIGGDYMYKVSVSDQANQSAIDLLYSQNATQKDVSTSSVELLFEHMLSKIVLSIESDEFSDAQLAQKTISAVIGGMPTTVNFNLAQGGFETFGAVTNFNMLRTPATTKLEATIIPSSYAGRTIEVTIDGKSYKNNILDTDTFESGKSYSYTASVGGELLTITRNSVVPWDGITIEILDITEKFTDPVFRAWVFTEIEKNPANGDRILSSDVAGIEYVALSADIGLTSISGIEYFTAMKGLACTYNKITSLDLSKNKELVEIHVGFNELTLIDLSQNTKLEVLKCDYNKLTTLNVSNNLALMEVKCDTNPLVSLDVSGLNKLTILSSSFSNTLTSLNTTGCTALEVLQCSTGLLSSLDLSTSPNLTYLDCSNNKLASIDLSQNVVLDKLFCQLNDLPSLDVLANIALTSLHCYDNLLTSLNLSPNAALVDLKCHKNQLSSLDVAANTALKELYCHTNLLISLDVSANTALENLQCYNNQLTTLDVSQSPGLEYLYCINNQLTSLDVSQNLALVWLRCDTNQLTSLDISKNTAIETFYCHTNPGELDGADYKFKVNVWTGFDKPYLFTDPTNNRPTSALRGVWLYTPEGEAERTVTVEYIIP